MPTREEIDTGLFRILSNAQEMAGKPEGHPNVVGYHIKKYLHSQGGVLKVDRELPPLVIPDIPNWRTLTPQEVQQDMLKAGYVVVESLIKEEK